MVRSLCSLFKFTADVRVRETWNVEDMHLSKLLAVMDGKSKCTGFRPPPGASLMNTQNSRMYTFVSSRVMPDQSVLTESVSRSRLCLGAVEAPGMCCHCQSLFSQQEDKTGHPSAKVVHPKTPLSTLTREDLVQEIRHNRQSVKQLEGVIRHLQAETDNHGVNLSPSLTDGLFSVMSDSNNATTNEMMNLFWAEQQKAHIRNPKGMRWHPMMIRFAIFLHYQSPRCYEALRHSGVLQLPNKSTLRDYTNVIQPKAGFQTAVFQVNNRIKLNLYCCID